MISIVNSRFLKKIQDKSFYRKGHFQENGGNHIEGEFLKIREVTLVINFVIFLQK